MRKCVILLLAMASACLVVLVGCQSHSPAEDPMAQNIPEDFVYAGNRYISTGVMVASQDIDADTPSNVMYIGSSSQSGEYGVYLIQGFDQSDAIALKIGVGGSYSYPKYERVYGQEEPADFLYQGRDYVNTGEIADIERVAAGDGMPQRFSHLGSVVYQGTTYDVYSIQGRDENQAIALRIAKAGKTVGFLYYYFKYERR
jgi:hypothetical protein